VLPYVEKPSRYIGGELNSVRKEPAVVEASFALLFPDVYEVGMSHLGLQILYFILNGLAWAAAERGYAVWPDMQQRMLRHGLPLYTLESRRPVRSFDVVGFTLQYELLYTNVLAMLDLARIPVLSAERGPEDPIIIAGGPGASSPEPMADFIDLFFVGDGEDVIVEFAELIRRAKRDGAGREEIILEAGCSLRGAYAPALYRAGFDSDGTLRSVQPTKPGLPERIKAAKVTDLDAAHFPAEPIVPLAEPVHDRAALEIMRGCTRGCRFCQAGMLRRPVRPRSADRLLAQAEQAIRRTGCDELALSSLSSSDYPGFMELLERMNAFAERLAVNLSLSSLRISDQLRLLPEVLGRVRKSGLTVAPEAATDRLRRVINKDIPNEALLEGVRAAFAKGWRQVKLYFMIGLPTETPEDQEAIVELCERVSAVRKDVGGARGRVNASIATFIPKPHTPFQWEPMIRLEDIHQARSRILAKARIRSVRYEFHDAEASVMETVLSRGDRRLGRVIRRAYELGQQFDAWGEHFSFERWQRAFRAEDLTMEFYAHRLRPTDEVTPWDHIDFGLSRDFLLRERQKALAEELTPDCRTGSCPWCGVCAEPASQTPG
jgi:radical SAM family uncharacterized protein